MGPTVILHSMARPLGLLAEQNGRPKSFGPTVASVALLAESSSSWPSSLLGPQGRWPSLAPDPLLCCTLDKLGLWLCAWPAGITSWPSKVFAGIPHGPSLTRSDNGALWPSS